MKNINNNVNTETNVKNILAEMYDDVNFISILSLKIQDKEIFEIAQNQIDKIFASLNSLAEITHNFKD